MGMDWRPFTQVAVNCTLEIPKHKPGLEFVLRGTSMPAIEKAFVIDKRIVFSGELLVGVEYVACVEDCS